VAGLIDIVEIAEGGGHSLALKSDGTVWSWGQNISGQLGVQTIVIRTTPVQVTEPATQ
jgi:alpha-tubulin suppressor-like RCC1 family protein